MVDWKTGSGDRRREACRAAVYALWKWMEANKIYLVNRVESEVRDIITSFKDVGFEAELIHFSSTTEAAALEASALIVGTVPDMFLAKKEKGFVLEMCYHSSPRTCFFSRCEETGSSVLYGTEAMIWQGVALEVIWTELPMEKFKQDGAKRAIAGAVKQHLAVSESKI